MSRKREKPYFSQPPESSKRRRTKPTPSSSSSIRDEHEAAKKSSSASAKVVATGLPSACSVLKLKSRLEMYGCVSRLRIDRGGVGYITFRSRTPPMPPLPLLSIPCWALSSTRICKLWSLEFEVQVSWANDPVPQWKEGVRLSSKNVRSSSRLLRPELPLSKYGRENKLAASSSSPRQGLHNPFKGREIVATMIFSNILSND
ncbi:hypothetical protein Syun_023780 [Stephania yunnanensis]|uniref:RRM domain-containing protein n=1 Tax=Stephania yunnanensis TaxID=152371 RepID=A0AAP0FQ66_9MAGN